MIHGGEAGIRTLGGVAPTTIFPPQADSPRRARPSHTLMAIRYMHGGEAGIRTLGGVAPTTIFETVPFNHSGTSPTFPSATLSLLHFLNKALSGRLLYSYRIVRYILIE